MASGGEERRRWAQSSYWRSSHLPEVRDSRRRLGGVLLRVFQATYTMCAMAWRCEIKDRILGTAHRLIWTESRILWSWKGARPFKVLSVTKEFGLHKGHRLFLFYQPKGHSCLLLLLISELVRCLFVWFTSSTNVSSFLL